MMLSRRWKDWVTVGTGLPAELVWHFTIGWLAVCSSTIRLFLPSYHAVHWVYLAFLCACVSLGLHSLWKEYRCSRPWIKISSCNTLSLAADSAMVLWDKTFKLWPLAGGLMIMLWVIWWHLKEETGIWHILILVIFEGGRLRLILKQTGISIHI